MLKEIVFFLLRKLRYKLFNDAIFVQIIQTKIQFIQNISLGWFYADFMQKLNLNSK